MKQENENREIEVRFLDIDKNALTEKLRDLGAKDFGEDFLREIIFYDKNLKWQYEEKKFVRIRQTSKGIFLAFKNQQEEKATGTIEIETKVEDFNKTREILEEIRLLAFREQEKKRHTFELDGVVIDIDTWPSIPTYVELEGPSGESLKITTGKLGLEWSNAQSLGITLKKNVLTVLIYENY